MLPALLKERLRLHRLQPSRPLKNVRQVAAYVRERKIVMASGRSSLPAITEAIAGRPLKGSWMAHPEVFQIYELLQRLQGFQSAPLIMGKEVLFDPSLTPAISAVAGNLERRRWSLTRLTATARKLLARVEAEGEVRMDRWPGSPKENRAARVLLQRHLLVHSEELHTESGYHTTVVKPWKGRSRLGYAGALEELFVAAVRSAVVVPEREAARWFAFAEHVPLERAERITAEGSTWLYC